MALVGVVGSQWFDNCLYIICFPFFGAAISEFISFPQKVMRGCSIIDLVRLFYNDSERKYVTLRFVDGFINSVSFYDF